MKNIFVYGILHVWEAVSGPQELTKKHTSPHIACINRANQSTVYNHHHYKSLWF